MTGFGGSPPGEGEGQPGAPGGQVLQAQPGAGGQVLLPPGGAARDGRHGPPLDPGQVPGLAGGQGSSVTVELEEWGMSYCRVR